MMESSHLCGSSIDSGLAHELNLEHHETTLLLSKTPLYRIPASVGLRHWETLHVWKLFSELPSLQSVQVRQSNSNQKR